MANASIDSRALLGAGGAAAPKAASAVEEGEGATQQTLGKPFVEVQWEMLHHNPSILYFRALLLQIQVSTACTALHCCVWAVAACTSLYIACNTCSSA